MQLTNQVKTRTKSPSSHQSDIGVKPKIIKWELKVKGVIKWIWLKEFWNCLITKYFLEAAFSFFLSFLRAVLLWKFGKFSSSFPLSANESLRAEVIH